MIKRFYLPDANANVGYMNQSGQKEVFQKIHLQIEMESGDVYSLVNSIDGTSPPQVVPFMTIPVPLKSK